MARFLEVLSLGGEAAMQARAKIQERNTVVARAERALEALATDLTDGEIRARRDEALAFSRLFEGATMAERKSMLRCFIVRVEVESASLRVHRCRRKPPSAVS